MYKNVYKAIKNDLHKNSEANIPKSDKLIHYSKTSGLDVLDPKYQGTGGIKGEDTKQGISQNPVTWYYKEGVEPESIVTTGAKSKYIVNMGDKKLYDIGRDLSNLYPEAKKKAQAEKDEYIQSKGWTGKYMASADEINQEYNKAIKDAGFHGIFNSTLEDTMKNVVGLFHPEKPEAEHPIHQNDFKETSSVNHHETLEKGEGYNAVKNAALAIGLTVGAYSMTQNSKQNIEQETAPKQTIIQDRTTSEMPLKYKPSPRYNDDLNSIYPAQSVENIDESRFGEQNKPDITDDSVKEAPTRV
jgi:hypothetical protein